jgi:hypothetical protein
MVGSRLQFALSMLLVGCGVVAAHAELAPASGAANDPIAREVARWQERIRSTTPPDEESKGIREGSAPLLALAERELGHGRRWFALTRLAFTWTNLEAADYRASLPGDLQKQMAGLEREWERLGPELRAAKAGQGWPSYAGAPAVARALGEVARSEAGGYFDSSLEYGKATAPEYGLFYLGAAEAQLSLARLVASVRDTRPAARELAPRSVAREIVAVEDALLAAYVPPASVAQHSVFIRISALLKQAGELDRAGLHYGAAYKLLDAKMRLARLLAPERKLDAVEAARRAAAAESALAATGVDDSIARTFVEIALAQVSDPDPAMMGGETAAAVFEEVLPLYLSLLGPAPPGPPERVAEVTVTLVRWPYT